MDWRLPRRLAWALAGLGAALFWLWVPLSEAGAGQRDAAGDVAPRRRHALPSAFWNVWFMAVSARSMA